jgi:DNA-binding NarL/FixJ family response regulator
VTDLRVWVGVRNPAHRAALEKALHDAEGVRVVDSEREADAVLSDAPLTDAALTDAGLTDAPTPAASNTARLTRREHELLQLLAEGLSNRRIAERLGISTSTVKFHLAAVFEKLHVHTRSEAVAAGVRRGFVLL